jgi:2-desacetyl-2-hydroxyethyl bacteriochlorophyllide A dehydrogenase
MQQAVMTRPGTIRFDEVAVAAPAPDEVRIKVRQIGICGSDIHVWHGTHPFTPYPVIQGHEFVGVVDAVGSGVDNPPPVGAKVTALPQIVCGTCGPCRKGRFNVCEHLRVRGFQADGCGREFYNIPAERVVVLPDGFTGDQGAFMEPVAVAVHACGRAGDLKGRNVVVSGAGTIGNLIAQVATARGAHVLITDVADSRLAVARACGIAQVANVGTVALGEAAGAAFGEAGFDLAIEAAGAEASLAGLVAAIEKGGTVLIVGVYGKPPTVDMAVVGEHEIELRGSMMYWRDDWIEAARLVGSAAVNIEQLVSRHFRFDAWADAYRFIDANGAKTMKVMVDVSD